MNKKEIAKWIYENCYEETHNKIDLSNIDFSEYKCDVRTSGMVVNGRLNQSNQRVTGLLEQNLCEAKNIAQDMQKADFINQSYQEAKIIDQDGHKAATIKQDTLEGGTKNLFMLELKNYFIDREETVDSCKLASWHKVEEYVTSFRKKYRKRYDELKGEDQSDLLHSVILIVTDTKTLDDRIEIIIYTKDCPTLFKDNGKIYR